MKKLKYIALFVLTLLLFPGANTSAQESGTIIVNFSTGDCTLAASNNTSLYFIKGQNASVTVTNNTAYSIDVTYPSGNFTLAASASNTVETTINSNVQWVTYDLGESVEECPDYSRIGKDMYGASGSLSNCKYLPSSNQWEVDAHHEWANYPVTLFNESGVGVEKYGNPYTGKWRVNKSKNSEILHLRNGASVGSGSIASVACSYTPPKTETTKEETTNTTETVTPTNTELSTATDIPDTDKETDNTAAEDSAKESNINYVDQNQPAVKKVSVEEPVDNNKLNKIALPAATLLTTGGLIYLAVAKKMISIAAIKKFIKY